MRISVKSPLSPGQKRGRSLGAIAVMAALLGGAWATRALAQGVVGPVLYSGDKVKDATITLANWGSGSVTEDEHYNYGGVESLKLVTHGLYQGARLRFPTAVDLGPYITDKNTYLQFAIIPPVISTSPQSGSPYSGGYPGGSGSSGYPGGSGSGSGSSGYPGGSGSSGSGSGSSGYPGGSGGSSGVTPAKLRFQRAHPLENLRVVLVTSSGRTLELLASTSYAAVVTPWRLLSIPIQAIPGLKAGDAEVKELRIFGDTPGTLYIGKISVVTDPTPITIDPIEASTVQANQKRAFTAVAHGGITPLKYSWDFDATDGIQEDATGRAIVHPFRKEGDYTITLTVSDPYGVKAPAVQKFNVHVSP